MATLLNRHWQAFKHYRPGQILARLETRAKQQAYRWLPALGRQFFPRGSVTESGVVLFPKFNAQLLPLSCLRQCQDVALNAGSNRFVFLNHPVKFGNRIDWQSPQETRLWRYNLHYGEYIRALALAFAAGEEPEHLLTLQRLIAAWIADNPVGVGVGWHAYPLSLRLVNWLYALQICKDSLRSPHDFYQNMLNSLYIQAKFLAANLERDCLGNHLLADAKALTLAGLCLSGPGSGRWLQQGQEILWKQLAEQILSDGGHYERSPMYHTLVLSDYLEIVATFDANGLSTPPHVPETLGRMARWLASMLHPDGEISLFQDSALGIAPNPADVLVAAGHLLPQYVRVRPRAEGGVFAALLGLAREPVTVENPGGPAASPSVQHLPQSGYMVFQGSAQGDKMIVDVGSIGPAHIPAHGHCGIFSFELSVAGRRLVVDSGVETYHPGRRRDYYRSTRAHNTVEVDQCNQSDVFSAFRVGRRARVRYCVARRGQGYSACLGQHDGYAHLDGNLLHTRAVFALDEGAWLVLDRFPDTGGRQFTGYYHFHPEVALRQVNRGTFDLLCGPTALRLLVLGSADVSLLQGKVRPLQGWYAAEFGKAQPNPTLAVRFTGGEPIEWGVAIFPGSWPQPRVTYRWQMDACEFAFSSLDLTRQGRISAKNERGIT